MELIYQPKFNGGAIPLITCRTKGCSLSGVTLSPDQYANLTSLQLDSYRQMVAKRAQMEAKE